MIPKAGVMPPQDVLYAFPEKQDHRKDRLGGAQHSESEWRDHS